MADIDGVQRTPGMKKKHAANIAVALGTTNGKYLMEYLRQITTNRVMPNSSTSEALWHLEGQRHLTMILNHWQEEHERSSGSSRNSN